MIITRLFYTLLSNPLKYIDFCNLFQFRGVAIGHLLSGEGRLKNAASFFLVLNFCKLNAGSGSVQLVLHHQSIH